MHSWRHAGANKRGSQMCGPGRNGADLSVTAKGMYGSLHLAGLVAPNMSTCAAWKRGSAPAKRAATRAHSQRSAAEQAPLSAEGAAVCLSARHWARVETNNRKIRQRRTLRRRNTAAETQNANLAPRQSPPLACCLLCLSAPASLVNRQSSAGCSFLEPSLLCFALLCFVLPAASVRPHPSTQFPLRWVSAALAFSAFSRRYPLRCCFHFGRVLALWLLSRLGPLPFFRTLWPSLAQHLPRASPQHPASFFHFPSSSLSLLPFPSFLPKRSSRDQHPRRPKTPTKRIRRQTAAP